MLKYGAGKYVGKVLKSSSSLSSSGPTQSFDFTTGVLPSGLTFTRASAGNYYNSSGLLTAATTNAPRFDYNPSTLTANNLLIEPASTNLIVWSNGFGHGEWVATNSSVQLLTQTGPDGVANTASGLSDNAVNGTHGTYPYSGGFVVTNATPYTFTIYAKYIGVVSWVTLSLGYGADVYSVNYNLQTGVLDSSLTSGSPVGTATSIQALPSGWYRIKITATSTGTLLNLGVLLNKSATLVAVLPTYVGGGQGIAIYGAQLEAQNFLTSYIISNSGSTTTRSADSLVSNSFAWFNATTGTYILSAKLASLITSRNTILASLNDNSANNAIFNYSNTSSVPIDAITIATVERDSGASLSALTANANFKTGLVYASGANLAAVNGNLDTAGTFGASTLPSGISQLNLGGSQSTTTNMVGWLNSFTYYNTAFTSSALQAATT